MTTRILAVETANPELKATQQEVLQCLVQNSGFSKSTLKWYEKFLKDDGIQTRYFGLPRLDAAFQESGDEAIHRYQKVALRIALQAVEQALKRSGFSIFDLNGIVVATCTGYLCPGLSTYLAQALGMSADVYTQDLSGIGCGAALPALRAGELFLNTSPHSRVAVVCVEVCSAALYWGEDVELILSNAIFADGAACAILSNCEEDPCGLMLHGYESILWPQYREDLRFKSRNSRLCNVISPRVPQIAAQAVDRLTYHLEARLGRPIHYAVHPGGRKVLDTIEEVIPEMQGKLGLSRDILRRFGNMSSPSILFVLKEMLNQGQIQSGELLALYAFGAGFTAFGLYLEAGPSLNVSGCEKGEVKKYDHSLR